MKTTELKMAAAAAAIASATDNLGRAAEDNPVEELVSRIKSADDKVRGTAWQGAGSAGAPAVKPLAAVMTDPNSEVARSAKRALWKVVRHAGRPGAETERKAVQAELLGLLKNPAVTVRREALWMLSEVGDPQAVDPMATLLSDAEAREDARCALLRLPGQRVPDALRGAFRTAPEDFKFALGESLRQRGETVEGYPSKKRIPLKQTGLKPLN